MRPLTVPDAETIVLGLQDEIRRSADARYDHRLHGVLLVAQGMTCPEVGRLLGDSPRTVENWIQRFDVDGLAGLSEGLRPGRPSRLSAAQLRRVDAALRKSPMHFGLSTNIWDGKTLSAFIGETLGVALGARQCQRLFRRLGFRLRKPRPQVAQADPERHRAHKKTPRPGPGPGRRPVGD